MSVNRIAGYLPADMPSVGGFKFGDIVYHTAATRKAKGIVTSILLRKGSSTIGVTWGDAVATDFRETYHDSFELSDEYTPDYGSDSDWGDEDEEEVA